MMSENRSRIYSPVQRQGNLQDDDTTRSKVCVHDISYNCNRIYFPKIKHNLLTFKRKIKLQVLLYNYTNIHKLKNTHVTKTFILHPHIKWCGCGDPLGSLINSEGVRRRKSILLGMAIALFLLAIIIILLAVFLGKDSQSPTLSEVRCDINNFHCIAVRLIVK